MTSGPRLVWCPGVPKTVKSVISSPLISRRDRHRDKWTEGQKEGQRHRHASVEREKEDRERERLTNHLKNMESFVLPFSIGTSQNCHVKRENSLINNILENRKSVPGDYVQPLFEKEQVDRSSSILFTVGLRVTEEDKRRRVCLRLK